MGVGVAGLHWIMSCQGLKGEKLMCMFMTVVSDGVGLIVAIVIVLCFILDRRKCR